MVPLLKFVVLWLLPTSQLTVAHRVIVNVFKRADQIPQHSKVTHPAVKYMEEVVQTKNALPSVLTRSSALPLCLCQPKYRTQATMQCRA